MESDPRSREKEVAVDSESFEILTFDPLAELAAELALCYLYIEQNIGGFCDWCTCQLKYHAGAADAECEICGCYELHHTPQIVLPVKTWKYSNLRKDGLDNPSRIFGKFDGIRKEGASIFTEDSRYYSDNVRHTRRFTDRDRALAARAVLKELTE